MILHVLINIEIGRGRRVKAREKFVHDNQKLHLTRLLDEVLLDVSLKILGGLPAEHFLVDRILAVCGVERSRLVGSHHRGLGQTMLLEDLVVSAAFVDTARHQHRVAAATRQPVFLVKVVQNIEHDLLEARLGTQEALHRPPTLFQLSPGHIRKALGALFKPGVNLCLRHDVLIYAPSLVAQIQHHLVRDRLVVFVGMDIWAPHCDAVFRPGLVYPQERCAGKADECCPRQELLHRLMQLAGM